MAIIQLKDVKVYATFAKGFRVVEESKGRDGKDYSTRWTVWSDTLGVREGDIVSLSGFLSAKVNEWTDKDQVQRHSVELAINSPRTFENSTAFADAGGDARNTWPAGEESQERGPVVDAWNTDSEVPF